MRAARGGYRCVVVPGARIFHKNSRSTEATTLPCRCSSDHGTCSSCGWTTWRGWSESSIFPRYLAYIISYGGSLREKNFPDSVEACLDGAWHAFRGAGGPRKPECLDAQPLAKNFSVSIRVASFSLGKSPPGRLQRDRNEYKKSGSWHRFNHTK